MYRLSKRSQRELIGVYPELAFAVYEAIKVTKQDFMVFDGVRSMYEQKKLMERGASKTLKSYHLYGLAVDLVAYTEGQLSWDMKYYPEIAKAMRSVIDAHGLEIDWGYALWGWDSAHWQMTGHKPYYDIRKLKG